jgi:hypothetical protein
MQFAFEAISLKVIISLSKTLSAEPVYEKAVQPVLVLELAIPGGFKAATARE